ncbi:MAG: HAMP domain-containing protein [Clostridia bacterium]|nr:HAMP domain-containing protein [Clostridia bacterium]
MKKSIRNRLFFTISLAAGLFVLLFCILFTTYYDDYQEYRRQQQLQEAFHYLKYHYRGDVVADLAVLQNAELQYSIRTLITTDTGLIKYNTLLSAQQSLSRLFRGEAVTIFQLIDQLPRAFGDDVYFTVEKENDDRSIVIFSAGERSVGVQFIGLLGVHPTGDLLLLQMPAPLMRDANAYTGFFFLLAGALSLLLTLLFAFTLARRFTRPIVEMKEIAEHMASLDFSHRYTGPADDEIGELGGSINRLSQHLESTIRQLRDANARLEEENERARRLDEMRKNLLINVSHELKTPLALIQGYAEGLRINLNADEESREFYCDVIEEETRGMTRMVGDLLSVSRIEAGTTTPQPEPFEIDEMIDDLLPRLLSAVEERDIRVDCAPSGAVLFADKDMISQVLTNYLSNAIDHTPDGGTITIRFDPDERGDRIRLSVFNEGDPIPEAELPKIWQSFYKLDQARTRAFGGTGIGLSIVKAVIEAHRCRYGATARENGMEFWCTLPLFEQEDDASAENSPADAEEGV